MLQTFSTWHYSGAANEQSAVYCALVPVLFHYCHPSWSLPVYNSVRTSCLLHTATSDWLVRRVMALWACQLFWSMDRLYHKWLDTHNKTGNPIKLIFQVLNYTRKNRYPRLRSALTYIDEEHPSRIDFGKHKVWGTIHRRMRWRMSRQYNYYRLTPLLVAAFCELVTINERST